MLRPCKLSWDGVDQLEALGTEADFLKSGVISQPGKVKVVSSFDHLRDFIRKRMRMSHIYQPVMIKELLTHGGRATIHDIAAAFLARDASQLEST